MIQAIRDRVAGFGDPNRGLFLPVLGFPVRIHPSFWLVAILAGFQGVTHVGALLAWTLAILLSILVHELGHALMASRWTVVHRIRIHGFGGETTFRPHASIGWRQHLLIAIAGPGAGFGLAFVGFLLGLGGGWHWLAWSFAGYLLWVNVFWGIFNLLPIPPLDGGQAFRHILDGFVVPHAEFYAAIVGVIASVAAFVAAVHFDLRWAAAILVFYGFQNGQVLKLHYDLSRKTEWQSNPLSEQTRDRY